MVFKRRMTQGIMVFIQVIDIFYFYFMNGAISSPSVNGTLQILDEKIQAQLHKSLLVLGGEQPSVLPRLDSGRFAG